MTYVSNKGEAFIFFRMFSDYPVIIKTAPFINFALYDVLNDFPTTRLLLRFLVYCILKKFRLPVIQTSFVLGLQEYFLSHLQFLAMKFALSPFFFLKGKQRDFLLDVLSIKQIQFFRIIYSQLLAIIQSSSFALPLQELSDDGSSQLLILRRSQQCLFLR